MELDKHLFPILSNTKYTFLLLLAIGLIPRIAIWVLIPVDWNPDSYHHWQISYFTLKIGLSRGRLWDLNGCECYWGVVPHIIGAVLMGLLVTPSLLPYRILNLLLGGANTYLIYLIGRDNFYWRVGLSASLLYALYPIAGIFGVIALQEPLALFFALLSLALFHSRPGWAGFSLALAAQSRTEFWLVSILFVVGVVLIERFSPNAQAFFLSWLVVMSTFCILFRHWTSNPFYPLYWSLFNVFGGWTERGKDLPFFTLMMQWMGEKLKVWPTKFTGQILLCSALILSSSLIHMIRRRWKSYQLYLFFFISLVIFGPIFITYYPNHPKHLLYMLRMSLPIVAVGSILLSTPLYKAGLILQKSSLKRVPLELVFIAIILFSYGSLIPAYSSFQRNTLDAFAVADATNKYYLNGTIVCDHPTINYRLVSRWRISPNALLANHYSPHYYNISLPIEYAEWFRKHDVTIWLHYGRDAEPVWRVISREYPSLLLLKEITHGIIIYRVNHTALDAILSS